MTNAENSILRISIQCNFYLRNNGLKANYCIHRVLNDWGLNISNSATQTWVNFLYTRSDITPEQTNGQNKTLKGGQTQNCKIF